MTSLTSNEVAQYARVVRAALVDLPAGSARAILDGLDEHLAEVAAEGSVDLEATLGPPAAYAAELRASAGLPPVAAGDEQAIPAGESADETSPEAPYDCPGSVFEPDAMPGLDDAEHAEARSGVSRWTGGAREGAIARGVLVMALMLVAVVVIRASEPLGALEIIAITAGVAAAWWVIVEAGRRARLTGWWERRFPAVVAVGAVATATWLGGQFGDWNSEYVYIDSAYPVSTLQGGFLTVPEVTGALAINASTALQEQGFLVRAIDAATGGELALDGVEQFAIVQWMDPQPGTPLPLGAMVTLGVANVDGSPIITPLVPLPMAIVTTTAPPETTLVPTTTLSPTTVAARGDEVDTPAPTTIDGPTGTIAQPTATPLPTTSSP